MTDEIREVSNTIWNTSGKMTHNELDDLLEKLVNTALTAERERLVREIIENIPICRDRIQKCSCYDHYGNDAIFEYLNDLINPPSK